MAQPTDEPKVSILPEPELNPLLNPLLAAHMGRWAEVYFTNPPEKRAQAVSDLVRELASNPTPAEVPSQRGDRDGDDWQGRTAALVQSDSAGSYAEEAATVCETCGHKNSDAHRFCGMCGLPLAPMENSEMRQNPGEAAQAAAPAWYETEKSAAVIPDQPDPAADFVFQGQDDSPEEEPPLSWRKERPAELHMLSQYQPEPASHNYRLYLGVVVTILLALMVYVTWRNNAPSSSGNGPTTLPQAPPASSGEPQAAAPSKTAEDAPASQLSSRNTAEPTRAAAPPSQAPKQPDATAANLPGRVKAQAAPLAPANANSDVGAAGQGGFVELNTAEKYLNAGPGTARDSQQAASWLWRAVAKKNLTAALLLSDLYLRGDGVPKSCDQAHLLLDAAARKGVAAAAERLRNLRAFGCQ